MSDAVGPPVLIVRFSNAAKVLSHTEIQRPIAVLDEVSTAIARDPVARNVEVTCGGWRVFCIRKQPDNWSQVDRLVVEISRLKTSATENIPTLDPELLISGTISVPE